MIRSNSAHGNVVFDGIPGVPWQYTSPAAIADTADDEVKAAVAGKCHYVCALQLSNTDATVGTMVQVKDGSTVIWQGYVGRQIASTSGLNGYGVIFSVPLKGTANTALNVACVTTSSETYFSAQGYTAD